MDDLNSWTVLAVKAGPQVCQQPLGGGPQGLPVGPPAVATALLLQPAPDACPPVQLRRIGRQKAGAAGLRPAVPPGPGPATRGIAPVIQHDDERLCGVGPPELL